MSSEPSTKVFISYCHADTGLVNPVVKLLRANQTFVFQDIDHIRPGKQWRNELDQALDKSELVVVFWCEHASRSIEVAKEWKTALAQKKDVLPLLLDSTPLPEGLDRFQWIDFRATFGENHKMHAKSTWLKIAGAILVALVSLLLAAWLLVGVINDYVDKKIDEEITTVREEYDSVRTELQMGHLQDTRKVIDHVVMISDEAERNHAELASILADYSAVKNTDALLSRLASLQGALRDQANLTEVLIDQYNRRFRRMLDDVSDVQAFTPTDVGTRLWWLQISGFLLASAFALWLVRRSGKRGRSLATEKQTQALIANELETEMLRRRSMK